jgi:GNAT superfamily N-acetyltransferase
MKIVGVVRIDLIGSSRAGLRLVGIRSDLQRQGHGRVLLRLAEDAARLLGKTEIIINPLPDVAGVLPRQWLSPRRMGRGRSIAANSHSGKAFGAITHRAAAG